MSWSLLLLLVAIILLMLLSYSSTENEISLLFWFKTGDMLERGEADYLGLIGELDSKDEEYCDDV